MLHTIVLGMVLLIKNGKIYFAQSWAIYMKYQIRIMAKRKGGSLCIFGPSRCIWKRAYLTSAVAMLWERS
jgi:hypothetical protein